MFFLGKSKTFVSFATICTTFVLQKRFQHPYKENVCLISNVDVSKVLKKRSKNKNRKKESENYERYCNHDTDNCTCR